MTRPTKGHVIMLSIIAIEAVAFLVAMNDPREPVTIRDVATILGAFAVYALITTLFVRGLRWTTPVAVAQHLLVALGGLFFLFIAFGLQGVH